AAAYCWGYNLDGELGIGSTSGPQLCATYPCSMTPVAVAGGLSFALITVGVDYACGLTTNGAAYCWGGNSDGQLGNATTTGSATPVPVAGGLTLTSLSAGYLTTCGVTTNGAAYCWGWNEIGRASCRDIVQGTVV